MKKLVYLIYIITTFLACISLSCFGMPEREYGSTSENSALIGGNQQEIALVRIGNMQQNEIIGLWKIKNVKNNSHSQISFNENGYMQEDIYSDLTGEKLATIEGQYTIQDNRLEISIVEGDVYQFEYLLNGVQLKLKSLSN